MPFLRRHWPVALPLFLGVVLGVSGTWVFTRSTSPGLSADGRQCLNALRDDLNALYGYFEGTPSVNRGPCGRIAVEFMEAWNNRFAERARLAYVMTPDRRDCIHVLVRLPDGSFFDGGNGVMSREALGKIYPGADVEVPEEFDLSLLEQRSYGLGRHYDFCPNYDHATVRGLIVGRLNQLAEPGGRP